MIQISKDSTSQLISHLSSGQVVALPTETVYGLAISLNSPTALEKLIYLKRRDLKSGKIFTLVPESVADIKTYAVVTKVAREFIGKYLPGEITLILHKNPEFNHPYFNHFSTIGIRIPNSQLFFNILPKTGPLLLTSANPRGDKPATSSEEVAETLPKVDVIVEGKTKKDKLPTTILDLTGKHPILVRQGDLKIPKLCYN
ncbi:threonylcarbamoyl-AMP synthase [Candidatus Saccharibacteria bacterium]|nr:threonylcarbamoyl-AMP synthase [Candidatus Saccharibacteria bacterium]